MTKTSRMKSLSLPITTQPRQVPAPFFGCAQRARSSRTRRLNYLFPGRIPQRPINNPQKGFRRLLAAAGIENLRIHDLRHSFASLAVNAGATLYQVQHLLGHASTQTTQRYAHLTDAALREASQAVATSVSRATREESG